MNERIKELALQAMTYVTHNPKANKLNSGDMFDEKFAELIVRECIDTYDHWATHSMDKTAFVVARTHVKEHFGIEQ